jgi:hypothetical protein
MAGGGGKEPVARAVSLPVVAQQDESALWDRDDPISSTLAAYVDDLALAIDVRRSQVGPLPQPQATGVDGDEAEAIDGDLDPCEDRLDLFPREDDGKPDLPGRASDVEDTPLALERLLVEELDAAQGNRDGSSLELALVLEVEEVAAKLFFVDLLRGSSVVLGELPDTRDVGLLGSLGVAGELEVVDHALA